MPLVEQIAELPIVGGIDEKTSPRLCVRMRTQTNCRQLKSGALAKRYGTTCTAENNAVLGGGTPKTAELLTCRGSELVRVGYGELCAQQTVGSTDWIRRSLTPEAIVYRDMVTSGDGRGVYDPEIGYGSGYVIHACLSVTSTGYSVRVDVINATTGARVYSSYVVDSGAVSFSQPKIVVTNGVAVIVYRKDVALKARALTLSTMTWSAVTSLVAAGLVASPVTGPIEVCVNGTGFTAAWALTAGPPYLQVGSWNSDLTLRTAAVGIGVATGFTSFAMVSGTPGIWFGYANYAGGSYNVVAYVLNATTLATVVGPTTLATAVSIPGVIALGVVETASTGAVYVFDVTTTGTSWVEYTTTPSVGTTYFRPRIALVSKPWKDSTTGHVYALIMNDHATHGTLFLASLYSVYDTTGATTNLRLVATAAPRQVPAIAATTSNRYRSFGSISSVGDAGSGRYFLAAYVSGAQDGSVVAAMLDVRVGGIKPSAAQVGNMLFLSGGAPSVYAGGLSSEIGFAYEPNTTDCSVTGVAGGSLKTNARYRYLMIYEAELDDGSIVRSPVSDPLNPLTLSTGANQTGRLTVPYLQLTNKQDEFTSSRQARVVVYRTLADGATYYRLSKYTVPAPCMNGPGTITSATFDDTLDDTTLATREQLYTTGDVPDDEIPPSAAHVAVIDGRVWLSGTDDDSIWFSDSLVVGEVPRFSGSRTIAPFEGGRVVAMAKLDEKKIVFKQDAIYYMLGEGPNTTLTDGTFTNPTLIQSDVGCVEPRSIVATPIGLMFQSRSGIYMLGRDLSVTPIGKPIEDTLGSYYVSAATLVPDLNVVRFALAGTSFVLEFDLFHGGVWSTHVYKDGDASLVPISGATYHLATWKYINSSGRLFAETKTDFRDTRGASSAWVTASARTMPFRAASLQGCQRVWYAQILGDRKSHHDLVVTLYTDSESDTSTIYNWDSTAIAAMPREQPKAHVVNQECQSISVSWYDATPSGGEAITTGEGVLISGVAIEYGVESGLRRLPGGNAR